MNTAQPGLSIVEVLIAVLMLGISVTTLLSLQGVLSRGVFTVHATVERIPFIRNLFVEADRDKLFKKDTPQITTIEQPTLRLTYSPKGSLPKALSSYTHLQLETVDAEWSTPFGTSKESFARLRFVPKVEGT